MKPVDVLIVGGGPAGLATAIAASRKGLRVTVIECRRPPIDKTCGEGLLPSAIAALGALGVRFESHLGFAFTSFRFTDEKSSVIAPISRGGGIGVRRRDLHRVLIKRAEGEGVSLNWGARISAIQTDGVWVQGAFRSCRWLIGADGQNSAVRRFSGLETRDGVRMRFGFRQHFAVAPWNGAVEVHWRDGVQLIATPTGAEEICVVVLSRDPRMRIEKALERLPEIARRLHGAATIGGETGATTCLRRARTVVRGNVALVGDAACTVDGISGHGVSLALEEALALGDALERENLAQYEAKHARITKTPVRMTKLLLTLDASPVLRRGVLRMLARNPNLFSKLIAMHVGGAALAHRILGEHDVNCRGPALGCRLCEPN